MGTEQDTYILDLKGVKQFLKPNQDFTIGRALNHSITIEDLRISRTHCRFKLINGVWNVIDESVNGTIVDNKRILPKIFHELSNGNIINLTDDIQFTFFENTSYVNDMDLCDIVDKIEEEFDKKTKSDNPNVNVNDAKETECAGVASNVADIVEKGDQKLQESKLIDPVAGKVETELQCSICTELFVKAQTLNCSHSFCKHCINSWKKKNYICPICRTKIKTVTSTIVLDNLVDTLIDASADEVKQNRKLLLEERDKLHSKSPKKDPKFKQTRRSRRASQSAINTRAAIHRNLRSLNRVTTAVQSASDDAILISSSESDSDSFLDSDPDPDSDPEMMEMLMSDLDLIINQSGHGNMFSDLYGHESTGYVPGNPEVYYGGYGSCYRCGARGHWANGCPLR